MCAELGSCPTEIIDSEGPSPKWEIATFWSRENHSWFFPRNYKFLLFGLCIEGLYVHMPGMYFATKPSCARKGLGPGTKMWLLIQVHSSNVASGHGGPWCCLHPTTSSQNVCPRDRMPAALDPHGAEHKASAETTQGRSFCAGGKCEFGRRLPRLQLIACPKV